MFGWFVAAFLSFCVGIPAIAAWRNAQIELTHERNCNEILAANMPAMGNIWGGVETQQPRNSALANSEKTTLLPKLSAEQIQECIRCQLKPEIYALAIDGLPAGASIPMPSELVTWDVPTSEQTGQRTPTQTQTNERTSAGTGVTRETLTRPAVEGGGATGGVSGGGGAGGAMERFISQVLPAPKTGYDLVLDDVARKGKAYYLVQSALLIDPNMERLSQNWFLKEVFKISKNTKGHEVFKQLLAKVRSDLNL